MESKTVTVLGIRFFCGSVGTAIARMQREGGYLIAPSGTCFARLTGDGEYRSAVSAADMALADSGAMVFLWKLLGRDPPTRISGLKYIKQFVSQQTPDGQPTLWVMSTQTALERAEEWLRRNSVLDRQFFYVAPWYGHAVRDPELLALIGERQPRNVVIAIGSGPQEKLGRYLRDNLSYRPAIHCIGAALGFLTGDQVAIPDWADRFYLGWLLRLFTQPRIFIPRLARAATLPWLIARYGEEMPPLRAAR